MAGRSERVAEGGSRGNGKWVKCCVVLKAEMGMGEQNVEYVGWLFNASYSMTPVLVLYCHNPIRVNFLSSVNYVSLHGFITQKALFLLHNF